MERSIAFGVLLLIAVVNGDDALCHDQLVKPLPVSHLSSSDNRAATGLYTGPERGRLNTTEVKASNGTTLEGAWSPSSDSSSSYIQAMFDDVTMINSIMTQGRNQGNEFVKLYTIQYTEDGTTWKTVNNDVGVEQIFPGNTDSDTIQDSPLDCPIFAKGIRIVPKDWQNHIALRFDVKGCNLDNNAPAILTTMASANATPTFLPGIQTPFSLTTAKSTTVNLQTLIQWFKTGLSNVSATTTPLTTVTTLAKTTPPYIFHPGIPSNLLPSGVTQQPFTPMTTVPPFRPGIPPGLVG